MIPIFLSVLLNIPPDPLEVTALITLDDTAITQQTISLTDGKNSDTEKALAIFHFVRDSIPFGFDPAFYSQTATEVLLSGKGFCNTKSTLFIALLRKAGIPARQHFVNISSDILYGFLNPGTGYVDHSFTEVLMDGKWLRVDSYIVDKQLADSARSRLKMEGRLIGYGIHISGTSDWDGKSDSFIQFVNDGLVPDLSTVDAGIYRDTADFYASGKGINTKTFFSTIVFRIVQPFANYSIGSLRNGR